MLRLWRPNSGMHPTRNSPALIFHLSRGRVIPALDCLLNVLVECLLMPTVLRTGPYRFYFYSHEPNEPPHIHIDRDNLSAKFWLEPVDLARNMGFSAKELRRLQLLVMERQTELLEAWNGYFGVGG
jgi:hypothetical protein